MESEADDDGDDDEEEVDADDDMEPMEEQQPPMTPIGDDDSFEDANGEPHHNFLFQYVTHRICDGQYTENENGVSLLRSVATHGELAAFYCENRALIQSKREKYLAYNRRAYNTEDTDFIGVRGNATIYATHFKPQLDIHIQQFMHDEAEERKKQQLLEQQQQKKALAAKKQPKKSSRKSSSGDSHHRSKNNSNNRPYDGPPSSGKDRARYIQQAIRTRTLRLEHVNDEKELCDYFMYHIHGQDKSLRVIAHELFMVKLGACGGGGESAPSIASILASGTSGIGKSELIQLIRSLFHMEPGGENTSCYVELRFGNITNVSHCSAITGPGPGYADADKPCLVDHLCTAADFILEQQRRRAENDDGDEGSEKHNRSRVIVLFIDELCKAKADVGILNTFNSLLSAGVMQRASGNITFRLPPGVTLLFYATANFGADALLRSMLRATTLNNTNGDATTHNSNGNNYNAGKNRIIQDMRKRKMQECDIARLGEIVPFFPLSMQEAHDILRFNVDSFFALHAFEMHAEDRDRLVEFYLVSNYVVAHGMHQPCRKINKELRFHVQSLFAKSRRPTAESGTLQFIVIPYSRYGSATDTLMQDYPDITRALNDETNSENLRDTLQARADLAYFKLVSHGAEYINIVLSQIATNDDEPDTIGGYGEDEVEEITMEDAAMEITRLRRDNRRMLEHERRVQTLINSNAFRDSELSKCIRYAYDGADHSSSNNNNNSECTTTSCSSTTNSVVSHSGSDDDESDDDDDDGDACIIRRKKQTTTTTSHHSKKKRSQQTPKKAKRPRHTEGKYVCPGCYESYSSDEAFVKRYTRKNVNGEPYTTQTRCTLCKRCRR